MPQPPAEDFVVLPPVPFFVWLDLGWGAAVLVGCSRVVVVFHEKSIHNPQHVKPIAEFEKFSDWFHETFPMEAPAFSWSYWSDRISPLGCSPSVPNWPLSTSEGPPGTCSRLQKGETKPHTTVTRSTRFSPALSPASICREQLNLEFWGRPHLRRYSLSQV